MKNLLSERLKTLRAQMLNYELDTFLIMSAENRRYLTGFDGSNGIVIVTDKAAVLITDSRYVEQAQTEAPFFEVIRYDLDSTKTIAGKLTEFGSKKVGYETKRVTDFQINEMRKGITSVEFVPTMDVVLNMRRIKDEYELECLKKSVSIADYALADLVKRLKAGMTEIDVACELEYLMKKHGSEGSAFGTIAVSGVRTSLPHGKPTTKKIENGDMLTLDFGAVYSGYFSDITRTISFGQPPKRLVEIFDIVAKSQLDAFESIKPGVLCKDVDASHRQIFFENDVEQYALRGLGHGVGLEIHELPRVVMNNEQPLEKGMVFTIEPGIYIPGLGGVRTEDIVYLTDKAEVLTKSPRTIII